MNFRLKICLLVIGLVGVGQTREALAQKTEDCRLFFEAGYVRPAPGQAWIVRLAGEVQSLAGCYVIVHNAEGERLAMKYVPHGSYTKDAPLVIEVPGQEKQSDCRVVIVGHQDDILGLDLPMTSLQEVYGSSKGIFARGDEKSLWFKTSVPSQNLDASGFNGPLRVLSNGASILETTAGQGSGRGGKRTHGSVDLPGPALYELDVSRTFYFQIKPNIFFAAGPEKWFLPDPQLEHIAWWQLTDPKVEKVAPRTLNISEAPEKD